eukprot:5474664-Amphidinium_carterae.1
MDFPHKGKAAKKYALLGRNAEPYQVAHSWCALCWPVVCAQCALQHLQLGKEGKIEVLGAEKVTLDRQHLEAGLRLVRCGRRLQSSGDAENESIQSRIRLARANLASSVGNHRYPNLQTRA